jgi:hypothetical protein
MASTTVARIDHRGGPTTGLLVTGAFAIGLLLGAAAQHDRSGAAPSALLPTAPIVSGVGAPAARPVEASRSFGTAKLDAYTTSLANIAAARARHDARMAGQFRYELQKMSAPSLAPAIYARYSALALDIASARARHDARAMNEFRKQLSMLCLPPSLVAGQPGCGL